MSEHVTLWVDEAAGGREARARRELPVVALASDEAISRLFAFEVDCAPGDAAVAPRSLLSRSAHLILSDGHGRERHVRGIVAGARRTLGDDGAARLSLVVRPAQFPLTLGRSCRSFRDVSVVDVARAVLARSSAPVRFELGASYPVGEYRAQYREDDWTFLSRLLEDAGIHYRFDHDEDATTLVLSDLGAGAPDMPGGDPLGYRPPTARAMGEVCFDIGLRAEATSTAFAVASYDPGRPRLPLSARAGGGSFEHYDAPGAGPASPEECAARARIRHEAALALRAGVVGRATSVRLVPGHVATLVGHGSLDGRLFVVGARCRARQLGRSSGGEPSFECSFEAISADLRYRPAERTPEAKQAGLQSGVVVGPATEEIHPDDAGRIRVKLHWDREPGDERAGRFMRVAQRGTADSMLLPRVGWNVLTWNEEGAVDMPALLSRVHDAEHPPSHALPEAKTKVVFRTATTPGGGSFNEMYFEDKKGGERMHLHASRNMNVVVRNEMADVVERDSVREVAANHQQAVAEARSESITRDQRVTIGGDEKLTVVGAVNRIVGDDEREQIAARRNLQVGEAHSHRVAKTRRLHVGVALVDATVGPIAATSGSTTTVLVGGAAVRVSAKSITEAVTLVSLQTIGGVKIELSRKSRRIGVKKRHVENVGGAMVLKAGGAFGDSSKLSTKLTVGGKLDVSAPEVVVEGTEAVVLECGGSSLTITTDSIVLAGDAIKLDGSKLIDADAPLIEHN